MSVQRIAALCLVLAATSAFGQQEADSPGGERYRVHALRGARVVTRPGEVLEDATVVIRDGVVVAVGQVPVPPDAREWDMHGLTIYPGLIEPYLDLEGAPPPEHGDDEDDDEQPEPPPPAPKGARDPNPKVRAERSMAEELDLDADTLKGLRQAGFTAALLVPGKGVLRGTSVLLSLADGPAREQVIRADVAQHLAFEIDGWRSSTYPHSLMGSMALTRQTLLDAKHYQAAWAAYDANPLQPRPETNVSLAALQPVLNGKRPVCFEAQDAQMILRGLALLDEQGLVPWVVAGSNDLYRWLDPIRQSGAGLVVTLNFPPVPDWEDDDDLVGVETERLRQWYLAPEDPARLEQAGARFAFSSHGLKDRASFRARIREAIERGLSEDAALTALTTGPAALLQAPQLGVVAPGAIANLTITDGPLFAEHTRIVGVWVDGLVYPAEVGPEPAGELTGRWELELTGVGPLNLDLRSEHGELSATITAPGQQEPLELPTPTLWRDHLHLTLPAAGLGVAGDLEVDARVQGRLLEGTWKLGEIGDVVHGRLTGPAEKAEEDQEPPGAVVAPAPTPGAEAPQPEATPQPETTPEPQASPEPQDPEPGNPAREVLSTPSWPPLPEPAPPAVLVRDATIWTEGNAGTLQQADLLVQDGKIVAVGVDLPLPPGVEPLVIDGTGLHVTPGIVDCHSHSFISGGVNEGTHNCTAEVRVADVLDAETVRIYQQLAGGVTTANELHGSANAIGGQNAVVKLRWGQRPRGLLLAGAPPGIKFALGENPKRSGWGEGRPRRYPESRLGVIESIRERLLAARDYHREQEEWQAHPVEGGIPPRRDLQLEALAQVLSGERLVHCHSYRADEILALIRLAEEFGFTIGTFQHVLEGYKVADEIAAHGAGASTFSDWWAYKFEVYDAIAYNGALMAARGVLVSFNSDSSEMARRLNQEAGKAVRYGGMPEPEALALVTRNPAMQLGLGQRVGKLEPGYEADFVIWSADPLSMQAVCQQTWIDGQRYFDRQRDAQAQQLYQEERRVLVEAARRARRKPGARTGEGWRPTFGGGQRLRAAACCDHDREEDR